MLLMQAPHLKLIKVQLLDSEVTKFFRNYTCIKIQWFLSDVTISNNRGPPAKKFKGLAFQLELTDGFRRHPRC